MNEFPISQLKTVIPLRFYKEESGNEPVRKWIKERPAHERKIIGGSLQTIQSEWPIGMPLVRPLGKGLFELRSRLTNTIARIIFTIEDNKIILLHGFIKKSEKMPACHLKLAQRRASL